MTDIYVKIMEHLINGEKLKAKTLFKEAALAEGRKMLREFLEEENICDDKDDIQSAKDQINMESYFTNEDVEDGDAEDNLVDDMVSDDDSIEGDSDMVEPEGDEMSADVDADLVADEPADDDIAGKLMNIEDELKAIIATFEKKNSDDLDGDVTDGDVSSEEGEVADDENAVAQDEVADDESGLGDFDDLEESFYSGLEDKGELYKPAYKDDNVLIGGKKAGDLNNTSVLSKIAKPADKRMDGAKPVEIGKGPKEEGFEWKMSPNYIRKGEIKKFDAKNSFKDGEKQLEVVKDAGYSPKMAKDGQTVGKGGEAVQQNTKSILGKKK